MTREAVATRLEFVLEYTRVIDKQLTELIGDCGHLKDQLAYPTAQRLQNAAELGSQGGQQRPRDELGDPSAAVGVLAAAHLQRPAVEALRQMNAVDR